MATLAIIPSFTNSQSIVPVSRSAAAANTNNEKQISGQMASVGFVFASTLLWGSLLIAPEVADTAKRYVSPIPFGRAVRNDDKRNFVLSEIRRLASYKNGWNYEYSMAASKAARNEAEHFSSSIDFDKVALPHIALADDGEINFLWHHKNIKLDLGFFGDGSYSYYGRDKNGLEYFDDNVPITKALPKEIIALLAV